MSDYLIFTMDTTLYAAPVLSIEEVIFYTKPESLPCPDPLIAGLLLSRGKSISVVNLRYKFALGDKAATKLSRIIVFDVKEGLMGDLVQYGAIVDSVQEVVSLEEALMEAPPEMGSSISRRFIKAVAKRDDKFILVLDVDTIFSKEELRTIARSTKPSSTAIEPIVAKDARPVAPSMAAKSMPTKSMPTKSIVQNKKLQGPIKTSIVGSTVDK